MATTRRPIPKLRHRQDGLYAVRLNGHDHYLGRDETAATQQYHALVALWMAGGRRLPASIAAASEPVGPLVGQLVLAYLEFADGYYVGSDGKPTGQLWRIRAALTPLVELFAEKSAERFSPVDLRAVREHMLTHRAWVRRTVNHYTSIVKTLFRWGVEHGHVPAEVWHGLLAVREIPPGRTHARESEPVPPVADAVIEATLPHLPPVVADMVRVQRLTAMRPAEVTIMRAADIETGGGAWLYRPERHKLTHRGKPRVVQLGPRARAIIEQRLTLDPAAYLFVPEHGNGGEHYTTASYRRAITRACERSGVEHWTPNQLRHTAASELHREYGWDVAGAVLGHLKPSTTSVYVDRDQRVAAEAVRKLG